MFWPFRRRMKLICRERHIIRRHEVIAAIERMHEEVHTIDLDPDDVQWTIDCVAPCDVTDTQPMLDCLMDAYNCGVSMNRQKSWDALNNEFRQITGQEMEPWTEDDGLREARQRTFDRILALAKKD